LAKGVDRSGVPLQLPAKELKAVRQRELKWIGMMNKWDWWMQNKPDKVKSRCRKGIPPSLRGRAWCFLTGANYKMSLSAVVAHGATGPRAASINGRYWPSRGPAFNGRAAYQKVGNPDLWLLYAVNGLWIFTSTATKDANGTSCFARSSQGQANRPSDVQRWHVDDGTGFKAQASIRLAQENLYDNLVAGADDLSEDHPLQTFLEIVERDLDRTFPHHDQFNIKGGDGQKELRDILRAYAMYNPTLGYTQGMGMLAGTFLMQMPSEDAFWCLACMLDDHLEGFFDDGLPAVQLNLEIMHRILALKSPALHAMFEQSQMHPTLYATDWFMCCFVKTLPWQTVLRLWDMFFFEGIKVFFRAAMAVLLLSETHIKSNCPDMDEQMMYLRQEIPDNILMPKVLLKKVLSIKLKSATLAKIHEAVAAEKEKEAQERKNRRAAETEARAQADADKAQREATSAAAETARSKAPNVVAVVNV